MRNFVSLFAMAALASVCSATTYTVTLDPSATSAANRTAFLAGFSTLANGDTVVVQGTSPTTAQTAYMDFASVNLAGKTGITVQWDADLTAKVPAGSTTKSVLLRFDNGPGLTLDGLQLDGNSANTLQTLSSYAFSTDALLFVTGSNNVTITNFDLDNATMMGILVRFSDNPVVSNGTLDHYRASGIMLRDCTDGSIEYNVLNDQHESANWGTHSLDLFESDDSRVYYNQVSNTYNAAIQTTGCDRFRVEGNSCSYIGWNGFKSDGDDSTLGGANYIVDNTWDHVGGYALFFGGSFGTSKGSYVVDGNVWTNLINVVQPDNSEISWKFRLAGTTTSTTQLDDTASFTFTDNEVSDHIRVDNGAPALFSRIPCTYSVTGNTFDTVGPRNNYSPTTYGKVFYSNPGANESGNTYIDCVLY